MAIKNKNAWKEVKKTQAELQKGNERIVEIECGVATAQRKSEPTDNNVTLQTLREEVEA